MFWVIIAAVIFILSIFVAIYSMRGASTWENVTTEDDESLPPQPKGASQQVSAKADRVDGHAENISEKLTVQADLLNKDDVNNIEITGKDDTSEHKTDNSLRPSQVAPKAGEIHTIDDALAVISQHAKLRVADDLKSDTKEVISARDQVVATSQQRAGSFIEDRDKRDGEQSKELGRLLGTIAIGKSTPDN